MNAPRPAPERFTKETDFALSFFGVDTEMWLHTWTPPPPPEPKKPAPRRWRFLYETHDWSRRVGA